MLALIPARAGSKGLPGKNAKPLLGKALIAYSIEAALASRHISRVVVSTDSGELARIGMQYGAECPFKRPAALASDQSTAIEVYQHALAELEKDGAAPISEFVVLQPTSPLRRAEDIDRAITLYREKAADSVVSYCQESHPIKWHKYLNADAGFEDIFEASARNRQDERPSYYPNGAIYIFKRAIIDQGLYYTDQSFAYVMDRKFSVDIDDADDFAYAEFLLSRRHA